MKDKIMILGAGLMQKPAILAAKELGYQTVVADGNPNAICASLADCFVHIDLKDKEKLADFAKKINSSEDGSQLAAVFTAGTDFSANAAYVASSCGLKSHSYESCLNASDKVRMRSCFKKYGIPSPDFQQVDSLQLENLLKNSDKISFPKVIKPVDNMGGRGCRLVRNKDELEFSAKSAVASSRSSRAIFENYMDGAEFSIDAIVYEGTLTITGFADRHIFFPPYFIETGHTMPTVANSKIKNELIAAFALGIKSLGLTHGVAKADIKYTKDGPMIGEIAARLSGGYMSGWTFPYSSGLNLTKQALLVALGKEPSNLLSMRKPLLWQPHKNQSNFEPPFKLFEVPSVKVSAERAWISIPGKIKSIYGLSEAENSPCIKNLFSRAKEGDTVNFPRNNVEKCGNVISCDTDYNKAVSCACSSVSKITIRLKENSPITEEFLFEKRLPYEEGFPPCAFCYSDGTVVDFFEELNNSQIPDILENQCAQNFIPNFLKEKAASLIDWNHLSFIDAVKRFDKIAQNHKKLDGKKFWHAALSGSIQGMLYVCDSIS